MFLPAEAQPRRLAGVTYRCALCGKDAGSIEIWIGASTGSARGDSTSSAWGGAASPLGSHTTTSARNSAVVSGAGKAEIVITGVVGVVHIPRESDDAPGLSRLLAEGVAALYAHDEEWASFYCPQCDSVYCKDHWDLQVEFEDEPLRGWYDCTYGTCPNGHRRIVDD